MAIKEPNWQKPKYPKIDYQDLYYYSAPKSMKDKPKSLDELDPKLLETYKKLGIPLQEQARLNGIAVDAVFDSVSVATTFKDELTKNLFFLPPPQRINVVRKHPRVCNFPIIKDVNSVNVAAASFKVNPFIIERSNSFTSRERKYHPSLGILLLNVIHSLILPIPLSSNFF